MLFQVMNVTYNVVTCLEINRGGDGTLLTSNSLTKGQP